MELAGIGTDIFAMDRLRGIAHDLNDAFFRRSFDEEERRYALSASAPVEKFMGMFAGKEAIYKAISPFCNDFRPFEIRIGHTAQGMPTAELSGKTQQELTRFFKHYTLMISISYEKDCAVAFAVLCRQKEETAKT